MIIGSIRRGKPQATPRINPSSVIWVYPPMIRPAVLDKMFQYKT
jgi:hypothetical protein